VNPGEPPISVADFAVPERRLAIYIDGAAFHVGQRLRRDRFIRDRMRNGSPPWRVEELRAADLGQGRMLVKQLCEG
jgi:very-short-patch-repair endonuclease